MRRLILSLLLIGSLSSGVMAQDLGVKIVGIGDLALEAARQKNVKNEGFVQKKDEDFSKRDRGYKPLTPEKRAAYYAASAARHGDRLAALAKFQTLPATFDCRTQGWVLPVGDQGNCGSCYLYSTSYGTFSGAFVKAGYGKPDGSFVMSPQYGMDCQNFGGCGGGNGSDLATYAVANGWPAEKWTDVAGVVHNDYPAYSAGSQNCRKVPGAKMWVPANWGYVSASSSRPATTLEIKTALFNFGSLNISLDAGGQFSNGSGTITSLGSNIDHEIELVAWNDTTSTFTIKNQWGTGWGNNGYRELTYAAAQNLVDIFFVTATALPPPPPPPPPPGAPVITSAATVTIQVGVPATYAITATNSPTSFGAAGLPAGFALNQTTGVISGTATTAGTTSINISATNASGVGTAAVTVTAAVTPVPPPGGITTFTITGPQIVGGTLTLEGVPVGTNDLLTKLSSLMGKTTVPNGKEPPINNQYLEKRLSAMEADNLAIRKSLDATTRAVSALADSVMAIHKLLGDAKKPEGKPK